MSDRSYWPANYADEGMPLGRESATAWIEHLLPIGAFCLAAAWDDGGDELKIGAQLTHGEVVKFVFSDRYEDVEMTVYPDGTFFLHGQVDPHANNFWDIYGWEVCGDTPAEFARQYAEIEADRLQQEGAQRIRVGSCRWADESYRFVIGADGKGQFELLPPELSAATEPSGHS